MKYLATAALLMLPLIARADGLEVTIKLEMDRADFFLGGEWVTSYHIGPAVAKPFFWPVNAPGQLVVTRGWPMVKGLPKETTDHVHQKSAWFCHGDVIPEGLDVVPSSDKRVKGVDFWSESKGHGRIVCREARRSGDASLVTHNDWQDSAGTKILDETRTITLRAAGPGRLIVLDIDLHASVCPITFGDTKEGAMGVRVNDQMRLTAKGEFNRIVNADGKSSEREAWGMISNWCDYSGEVDGKRAGIALFDAPSNPSRAAWHVRGYGLLAANPFGRDESGFPARKGQSDLLRLNKGDHLKLCYAIYLHPGDEKEGRVAEVYQSFTQRK